MSGAASSHDGQYHAIVHHGDDGAFTVRPVPENHMDDPVLTARTQACLAELAILKAAMAAARSAKHDTTRFKKRDTPQSGDIYVLNKVL
eukprot:15555530-Heterocapsa_arctica.AAC.1